MWSPSQLCNTEWMSVVVPTTGTSSQSLEKALVFQWSPTDGFPEPLQPFSAQALCGEEVEQTVESGFAVPLEPLQPVQTQKLNGQVVEQSFGAWQNFSFSDLGLGNEEGSSGTAPLIPSKVNCLNDGDHPHEEQVLPFFGASHETDGLGQFHFNAKELDHFDITTEDSGESQTEAYVPRVQGKYSNETDTVTLMEGPQEPDVVALTGEESLDPPALRHQRNQPAIQHISHSQKELKRIKKNEYSRWYRQNKKEQIQTLETELAFLKQYVAKVDDVNRRLRLCNLQLDLEIKTLKAERGAEGIVTVGLND